MDTAVAHRLGETPVFDPARRRIDVSATIELFEDALLYVSRHSSVHLRADLRFLDGVYRHLAPDLASQGAAERHVVPRMAAVAAG